MICIYNNDNNDVYIYIYIHTHTYTYTYIHIYIYIHIYLGAKDCTPEIDTSEVIVTFNGCSVAFSNGSSLVSGIFQRIVACPVDFTGIARWVFSGVLQWIFMLVRSGVQCFALRRQHGPRLLRDLGEPGVGVRRGELDVLADAEHLLDLLRLFIHIYIYIYIYTHIHTYIHMYIYIYIYTHTYIHTYMHTYIHTYMHACMHACMHTYIHTYIHTYTYIPTYIT